MELSRLFSLSLTGLALLLSSCQYVNRLIKPGVYKPLEILADDTSKTFDDFTLTVQEITEEEYIQRRRVNVFEDPYTQERSDEAPRYLTFDLAIFDDETQEFVPLEIFELYFEPGEWTEGWGEVLSENKFNTTDIKYVPGLDYLGFRLLLDDKEVYLSFSIGF